MSEKYYCIRNPFSFSDFSRNFNPRVHGNYHKRFFTSWLRETRSSHPPFQRIFKLAQNSPTKAAGQSMEKNPVSSALLEHVLLDRVSIYANDSEIAHGEKSVPREFRWIKSSLFSRCIARCTSDSQAFQ